jgi:hypothetical protein
LDERHLPGRLFVDIIFVIVFSPMWNDNLDAEIVEVGEETTNSAKIPMAEVAEPHVEGSYAVRCINRL